MVAWFFLCWKTHQWQKTRNKNAKNSKQLATSFLQAFDLLLASLLLGGAQQQTAKKASNRRRCHSRGPAPPATHRFRYRTTTHRTTRSPNNRQVKAEQNATEFCFAMLLLWWVSSFLYRTVWTTSRIANVLFCFVVLLMGLSRLRTDGNDDSEFLVQYLVRYGSLSNVAPLYVNHLLRTRFRHASRSCL